MAVGRRTFEPFQQLRDEFDRQFPAFWDALSNVAPRVAGRPYPALNVWEEGDSLHVEAEVPGLESEQIDVTVVGNELTIKGQRDDSPQAGAIFHRRERGVGGFIRVMRLPVEVDGTRVQASLRHGVLLLTLPKSEAAKPRKIQVTTS